MSTGMVRVFLLLGWALVATAATAGEAPRILVLGDSLSAAYGIDLDQGWVALLRERLDESSHPHRVVNASVSGDTTRGALARLPRALERHDPELVIIELGGNDGLRGIPPAEMRANLSAIIRAIRAHGARVLLLGMRLPANYGDTYSERFRSLYAELAAEHDVPLVPFFLGPLRAEGDLDPALMQTDGIHPNARAQPRLMEHVWQALRRLIRARAGASRNGSTRAADGS